MQGYLEAHGLRLCPGHGVCCQTASGHRHLVSSKASETEIGYKLRDHIRQKCRATGRVNDIPTTAETIGKIAKNAMIANPSLEKSASDINSQRCTVENKTKLLYCCGCRNSQPMPSDSFKGHLRAEGNQNKCRWSVWGKSDTEKLVLEITALFCCRVRCAKATCGLWIIRSRVEPDMSKLSDHIRKIMARRVDRGGQKSDSGDTSTLIASSAPSVISGRADEGENSSDSQPAMEAEESAADTEAPAESDSTPTASTSTSIAKSTKPVILLLGYTFRQETNDNGPTYEELLEEARYFHGKDNTQLPGAIRDKARIVRLLDRGFDCFCVSKSNKDENDESMHYYGDFCDRKFVQELRETLCKYGRPHPVQICVDCE